MRPLPATSPPQEAIRAFLRSLNEGRLKLAGKHLVNDACFVTPDRTAVHGRGEIVRVLAQLVAIEARIEVLSSLVLMAGRIAIVSERWGFSTSEPQGDAYWREMDSTVVLQQFEEGWKLAIVAPWR